MPKTVKEWLETLPEPLRGQAFQDAKEYYMDWDAVGLHHAIHIVGSRAKPKRIGYWEGVQRYLEQTTDVPVSSCLHEGYEAAREAFEAQAATAEPTLVSIDPDEYAELLEIKRKYLEIQNILKQ